MIEDAVLDGATAFLTDKPRLMACLVPTATPARRIEPILSRAAELANRFHAATATDRRSMLLELVDHIEVTQGRLRLVFHAAILRNQLGAPSPGSKDTETKSDTLTVDLPIMLKRRGIETNLVIGGQTRPTPDPALIKAVRSGATWFEELRTGIAASVGDLAKRHGVHQGDVSHALPLAFLAPDIVEAILDGQHPVELTVVRLKRVRMPLAWPDQRRILGFIDR